MTAMRQNLAHDEQNSDIITYGCGAHMLNLLAKDLDTQCPKAHCQNCEVL